MGHLQVEVVNLEVRIEITLDKFCVTVGDRVNAVGVFGSKVWYCNEVVVYVD